MKIYSFNTYTHHSLLNGFQMLFITIRKNKIKNKTSFAKYPRSLMTQRSPPLRVSSYFIRPYVLRTLQCNITLSAFACLFPLSGIPSHAFILMEIIITYLFFWDSEWVSPFLGKPLQPPTPTLCVRCSSILPPYKPIQFPFKTFIKMPYNRQSPSPGCEVLNIRTGFWLLHLC